MRHRRRSNVRRYVLPPRLRIRRLPEVVPISFGVLALVSAVLKPLSMPMCGPDPFEVGNGLMMLVEFISGPMFLRPSMGRRMAALLWALLMPAAALYLTYMHHRGFDVRSCGCFGPVKLEFTTHLAVIGVLCAVATLVFLREETRAQDRAYGPDVGDPRARRRLVRPFE